MPSHELIDEPSAGQPLATVLLAHGAGARAVRSFGLGSSWAPASSRRPEGPVPTAYQPGPTSRAAVVAVAAGARS